MSNPPRIIRRDTRAFISAVTRELGSVRKLVKKALEDNDSHAVEQDTRQDYNPAGSAQQLDQQIRSLQFKVERLADELQHVDQKLGVHGGCLRSRLLAVAALVVGGLGALGSLGWRQQVERRAQQQEQARQHPEREYQERERITAEAARTEAQTIQQVQRQFAERFLEQLLTNKQIKAEDARQQALKE
jgi:hypothetical protein